MRVLLLLPLSRFHVEYLLGSGRPFSDVDRLVLRAIAELDQPTLQQLQTLFRLPRRLLLEVLVTLLEEGWLAFDREGRFALTTHGQAALGGKEKSRTMRTREQRVSVWQEGYCGGLLATQLPYATEGELKRERHAGVSVWDLAYQVKVRCGQNELDRGIVRQLLRQPKEGWIYRVTSVEPRGLAGCFHLPVGVDLDARTVTGLPEKWHRQIAAELLEVAERVPPEYRDALVPANYFEPLVEKRVEEQEPFGEDLPADAILATAGEHEEFLTATLGAAREGDSILIASRQLDTAGVQRLAAPLAEALCAGAHIDVLWGGVAGRAAIPWREAEALAASTLGALAPPSAAGRLRWNPSPARSNACMVLWVRAGHEKCKACITSYEWLTGPAGQLELRHLGFCLDSPGVVAELCQHAAAMLSSGPDNELSGCADRWSLLAGELENQYFLSKMESSKPAEHPVEVTVVRDGNHSAVLRDMLTDLDPLILLAPAAERRPWMQEYMSKPERKEVRVCAGEEQPPHFRVPCVWKATTGLQASGALAGSRVLATNCNPLAAREPGSDGRADLGVVLKGKGLAERCAARLGLPLNGEETGSRL
jgi:hypothetical protein